MRVFISYSHQQSDWVCRRLLPCLQAAGAEVLIDRERFQVGRTVVGQMDALQDQADRHLLLLSPDYLASDYCRHEMQRAIGQDPDFSLGRVLPVIRVETPLPEPFTGWSPPLYSKLQDDSRADAWDALLHACQAEGLGCAVPHWLQARDEVQRFLQRGQSVNLVTHGKANWRGLLDHLRQDYFQDMACVDLSEPKTYYRVGLLTEICTRLGDRAPLPEKPEDLAEFQKRLESRPLSRVALQHFDMVSVEEQRKDYGINLFAALRHLSMDKRKLVLLVQSHTAFAALLPAGHPLSDIDIKTVELRGKP